MSPRKTATTATQPERTTPMNTKKLETFHHSNELNPKAFKAEAIVRTSGGREIQIISQSDKDLIATALVQLVARHVPAVITVEQALPLIYDVFSIYEPTWGHEHDEADRGFYAGHLYCRLTQRELADLVRTAVPDAQSLLPRRHQVGSWMPAW
nr:MAG TPA: hypothetical protein [Caudoviricetes sp.]